MMIDPVLTRWILHGIDSAGGRDTRAASARFADHEQLVLARTNSVAAGRGALQAPWPRALGTSPWGAQAELENGAALHGTRYTTTLLRHLTGDALSDAVRRSLTRVAVGTPMLLYVGSSLLPRHVTLVFVADEGQSPTLYDPGCGRVGAFPAAALTVRRLGLSGWDHPWFAVHPAGPGPARHGADVMAAVRDRMPSAPVADCSA